MITCPDHLLMPIRPLPEPGDVSESAVREFLASRIDDVVLTPFGPDFALRQARDRVSARGAVPQPSTPYCGCDLCALLFALLSVLAAIAKEKYPVNG